MAAPSPRDTEPQQGSRHPSARRDRQRARCRTGESCGAQRATDTGRKVRRGFASHRCVVATSHRRRHRSLVGYDVNTGNALVWPSHGGELQLATSVNIDGVAQILLRGGPAQRASRRRVASSWSMRGWSAIVQPA